MNGKSKYIEHPWVDESYTIAHGIAGSVDDTNGFYCSATDLDREIYWSDSDSEADRLRMETELNEWYELYALSRNDAIKKWGIKFVEDVDNSTNMI